MGKQKPKRSAPTVEKPAPPAPDWDAAAVELCRGCPTPKDCAVTRATAELRTDLHVATLACAHCERRRSVEYDPTAAPPAKTAD